MNASAGERGPILVFDTSGPALSVGLWRDGALAWRHVETFPDGRPGHAARLAPLIREGLEACRTRLADLAGVGVTIGPGSYTGLRIGLATAKGLALAGGVRLAGVGTLEALALPVLAPDAVTLAWIDARRGQVYAAVYGPSAGAGGGGAGGRSAAGGGPAPLHPPARLDRRKAVEIARDAAARCGCGIVRAVGSGSRAGMGETGTLEEGADGAAPGDGARSAGGTARPALVLDPPPDHVRLDALARLAAARLAEGGDDPLALAPAYVTAAHVGPAEGTANA